MTLNDLIEELENARKEKGGDSEILISFNTKPNQSGNSELVLGNILDIIYTTKSENSPLDAVVGIWAQEVSE